VNKRNKLKPKENDWNLPGRAFGTVVVSRRRHSGQGRPNLQRREAYTSPVKAVINLESSDSEYLQDTSSSSSEGEGDNEDEVRKPPASSRVILEVAQLTSLFDQLCNKSVLLVVASY
jgi:hypothetical protein